MIFYSDNFILLLRGRLKKWRPQKVSRAILTYYILFCFYKTPSYQPFGVQGKLSAEVGDKFLTHNFTAADSC